MPGGWRRLHDHAHADDQSRKWTSCASTKPKQRCSSLQAARLGVPILDLDSSFQKQFGLKNDGSHFLSGGHFNSATHAWVGAHLADYLKQNIDPLLTK